MGAQQERGVMGTRIAYSELASGPQVGNITFPNLRKISQEIRKQYYNSPVKSKCNNQHSRFEGTHTEERDSEAGERAQSWR